MHTDDRILAAWLAGSIARGEDDWLSDIDLYIVTTDESITEIVESRHEFAASTVKPVLSMDMMKNAPPGGAYLLVHYPGEYGPQHVDWFWQPESSANRPDDGLLFFDRAQLPVIDGSTWASSMHQTVERPAIESNEPIDLANHSIQFFWAMSLIVAKYIVREDRDTIEFMTGLIARTLDQIIDLLDLDTKTKYDFALHPDADQSRYLESLRSITETTKLVQSAAVLKGATVPDAAVAQIEQFFDTCELVALR